MTTKPVTKVLLESLSISKIVTVITNRDYLTKIAKELENSIQKDLNTLTYLREHFENNTKMTKPMVQLAAQHKPLIESLLNGLFNDSASEAFALKAKRYDALSLLILKVQELEDQEPKVEGI